MPFVQRVVQPINLSQVNPKSGTIAGEKLKFRCLPGKCKNNNCINREQNHVTTGHEDLARQQHQQTAATKTVIKAIVHSTATTTPTPNSINGDANEHLRLNGDGSDFATTSQTALTHNLTNGFASASFSYATDTEEDVGVSKLSSIPLSPTATLLPNMKKLKQHVEFLDTAGSTPTSPTRSISRNSILGGGGSGAGIGAATHSASPSRATSRERRRTPLSSSGGSSPTNAAAKKVTGFEFDCISNITLSNALRQLASLVLIASDIFDDLQQELQQVGDRARVVQRKIIAVEKRVYAYDPKKVTVPESDLFTFAQRKTHYECDKLGHKELFTAETRPQSVRALYEDAGKKTPPPPTISTRSTSFASADGLLATGDDGDGITLDITDTTGASQMAAGSDELVCTPVFGQATRKMRTRIDAEIEIRLPAAIEDLRKWTSTEALGDVTVTPDCMHHVDSSVCTSMVVSDNGVLTPALSPSVLSADAIDAVYSINVSNAIDSRHLPNDLNKDVPLNHRLPSPEEQCKIIALRYPAEVISVDTSGKRFERMCMARKSTAGCYNHTPSMGHSSAASSSLADGSTTTNNLNEDIQTVSRRSRSRKIRGKRRNTIAGIDQKEIQNAANGDPSTLTSATHEIRNTFSVASGGGGTNSGTGYGDGDGDDGKQRNKSKKFGRSKSSDILKKESVVLPFDKGKNTLTRLNSLKQWGRNRFKFMQRANDAANSVWVTNAGIPPSNGATGNGDVPAKSSNFSNNSGSAYGEKAESTTISTATSSSAAITMSLKTNSSSTVQNSSDVLGVVADSGESISSSRQQELINQKHGEARFSHERKPSYSSSEKSMSASSVGQLRGKLQAVKLRDTSSLNRQRRNGISANGLGGSAKDEQPHSSSGNWSASSESGRASIGSEITMQPKSSASNTSLNVSSFHPSSGPPSSMLSRRRFLNSSASSSVTSEGTATPELHDGAYPNHLDDETSSAYSCDTEGYYTSFHMDSGLRTLKEEEPTLTPLQQQRAQSNYSFGSQSNATVLSAENEYELFGKGSTSTTTSSAGTVCTTLMLNGSSGERSSLSHLGPDVPERISSLSNKMKSDSASNSSTLERSYSSSTTGSTLERTGTIKRNDNNSTNLQQIKMDENIKMDVDAMQICEAPKSQEKEFHADQQQQHQQQRIRKRAAQPLPEVECSECSDLEGVERIERIKQKTAINARRIPSMCIITPTTSDDENQSKDAEDEEENEAYDPNRTLTNEQESVEENVDKVAEKRAESLKESNLQFTLNEATGYCTVHVESNTTNHDALNAVEKQTDHNLNNIKSTPPPNVVGTGLNSMFGKLKVVLPNIKLNMPGKSSPNSSKQKPVNSMDVLYDDKLYDAAGEYVTIADISNNNNKNNSNRRHNQLTAMSSKGVGGGASSLGIYYSNDIVRSRSRKQQLEGNEPQVNANVHAKGSNANGESSVSEQETIEYVSLNELPYHIRKRGLQTGGDGNSTLLTKESNNTNTITDRAPNRTQKGNECANAESENVDGNGLVSMYAEISELREEIYGGVGTTPSPAATGIQSEHKGPRVRVNSQGKFIYDSDSLKRRKNAHTTFAPGPYVKETESALPEIAAASESEKVLNENSSNVGLVGFGENNNNKITKTTAVAKLLFLNGGPAATRKVANVRPIVSSTTPTRVAAPSVAFNMPATTATATTTHQHQQHNSSTAQKNLLANQTNPFFHQSTTTTITTTSATNTTTQLTCPPIGGSLLATTMMPSPSTKSTSSTGSTTSSSASTNTSTSGGSGSTTSTEEGYQRFYSTNDTLAAQTLHYQPPGNCDGQNLIRLMLSTRSSAPATGCNDNMEAATSLGQESAVSVVSSSPFLRNSPVYWTLQNNRKHTKPSPASRDDLYATPIRRSERMARAAATVAAANSNSNSNMSPIVARSGGGFSTSTPKTDDHDTPERLNTCADRIGQSKTSLMDFKKLLLAKSAKTSPIQKRVSAVELLKKTSPGGATSAAQPDATNSSSTSTSQIRSLNSSMKLLDLSGSPKTFANRRMLRQGQFGSPSKSFVPKFKNSVSSQWRHNSVQHTDIISTTIPEANSEEDHSNTSGGSSNSSRASSVANNRRLSLEADDNDHLISPTSLSYDLKRNFFLQNEENNFMRGEIIKHQNFGPSNGALAGNGGEEAATNRYVSEPVAAAVSPKVLQNQQMPAALETAL